VGVICDELTRDTFVEEVEALGIRLIKGDARAARVLRLAGIARAYSVVAVTSDKLTNVQICLAARHIRGDLDLVLRVFSDVLAEQLEGMFGLQTTYSTAVLAATTLAAAVVVRGTDYAVDVGERLMSTVRWHVQPGDEFDGQTIYGLRQQRAMVVVSLRRGDELLLPGENSSSLFAQPLQPDDDIVLLAEIHIIAELRSRSRQNALADARATRHLLSAPLMSYWPARFDEQHGLSWSPDDLPAAQEQPDGSQAARAPVASDDLLKDLLQREIEREVTS
jgi:Trk K+ transport system NAD-binding subunit